MWSAWFRCFDTMTTEPVPIRLFINTNASPTRRNGKGVVSITVAIQLSYTYQWYHLSQLSQAIILSLQWQQCILGTSIHPSSWKLYALFFVFGNGMVFLALRKFMADKMRDLISFKIITSSMLFICPARDKRVVCTSFLTMLTSFTSESCSSSDTDGTFITAVARKHMYTHCTLCTACHAAVGTLFMELCYIVHHISLTWFYFPCIFVFCCTYAWKRKF